MTPPIDVLILGAGAAGLAAAIFAGEAARGSGRRIVVVDGARKPGAKILVSGGGRCNVTNRTVTPEDYFGGPRPLIRNVLRAFDQERTLAWMEDLGVALKLEPTGKYFPVSDSARTVLDALLERVRVLGVELRPATRVASFRPVEDGFEALVTGAEPLRARRLVVATGGLSLPKSGSDGAGLAMLGRLGHRIVPTTPALTPLLLGGDAAFPFAELSGITLDARLQHADARGRVLHSTTASLLLTHFGLSGPAALDLSRHVLRGRLEQPAEPHRVLFGLPDFATPQAADAWILEQAKAAPRRQVATVLGLVAPERLARALAAGVAEAPVGQLPRDARTELARRLSALPLPVTGDRGYTFAETTAGGVDLREVNVATMESRIVPAMHLCGELLDVDGRIGGFNFQWAWATGYLAGRAAVGAL